MRVVGEFIAGILSVLRVTGEPLLYRYSYRNSAEGLHKDWLCIGEDIESVIGKLEEHGDK